MPLRPSPFPLPHPAQLRLLRNRLRLSIRDAGLTDLDPAHAAAAGPFWELEPTPLILEPDEWASLEAAIRQRARLVNAFLFDLYDRQQVLRERLLPPEIIFDDPYYRRPCLGLTPQRLCPATLLRFDLIKTAAGWMFTDTHANTPVGLSYAVQNRRFLTQEAGEFYRALPDYHSIINFPLQLLDALRALAPRPGRSPHIVVLTTGPRYPFFSEHSFLARKMGLPLAQGDDLLVLDNHVYFKTVAGLERVDVIYRRLNDAHIDPVVFATDREAAGIPGLMQCIRAGNVVLANAIGTGVAENRNLLAHIPRLTRFYLGEKPLLPTIPTFPCNDIDQLDYVLDHRDELRLRRVHEPRLGQRPPPPVTLGRRGLPRELREAPHAFVAQPRHLDHEPLLPGAKRSPPFRLSAYALSHDRSVSVLPGGVVALGPDEPPTDRVGLTADLIVLAGDADTAGTLADLEATVAAGAQLSIPGSRSAENLFWLGRYLERAEAAARMLSILDDVALEEIPARDRRRWLPVWRGLLEAIGHGAEKLTARTNLQSTLSGDLRWRTTLDPAHPGSLRASVNAAADNARQLRDYVSPEAGSVLDRLQARLGQLAADDPSTARSRGKPAAAPDANAAATLAIAAVLAEINAFLGTAERTMLHDAGWHFLMIGLQLERAIMTCSALRHVLGALDDLARAVAPGTPDAGLFFRDNPELSALLRMLGSQDAYRRLYQTRSQPRFVAELFLQQPDAPRSIFQNLHRIKTSLRAIRVDTRDGDDEPTAQAVEATMHFLASLRLERHFGPGPDAPGSPTLGDHLATLLDRLYDVQPRLSDHYFSHQTRLVGITDQGELSLR